MKNHIFEGTGERVITTVPAKLRLFLTVFCCVATLKGAILPDGSKLEIRLLNCVGSRVSRVGDPVEAVITTPVFDHDKILLEAGSTVSGIVTHLDRLGFGLRHTVATLDLQFTELHLSDGTVIPIHARVVRVEEARETVTDAGVIFGIHPAASLSTGVSGVFTVFLFSEPELRLPVLAFKFLAARSPDAEITFPAGTEMLLRVTGDVQTHHAARRGPAVPLLVRREIAQVQNVLARLSQQQTSTDGDRPSDVINVALIGTQQEVERAFQAAGWSGTEAHGVMALYHIYHCVVQRAGYSLAAMANLKLNGHPPDAAFQKSLDTLAKRHHIRLWRDEQSGIWLGAATEDVRYTVRGLHVTHGTDRHVDNERAKAVDDLVFTGCVDQGALVPRAGFKAVREEAHSTLTDGAIAVVELNACDKTNLAPSDPEAARPRRAIRAALAIGEDIARSNPVSVGHAIAKAMFGRAESPKDERVQRSDTYRRAIAISSIHRDLPGTVLALR